MEKLLSNLSTAFTQRLFSMVGALNKYKKMLSFAYMFAMIITCVPVIAMAAVDDPKFEIWQTVNVVLDIIYTFVIILGLILFSVGIILMFISKFNEQAITTPLIFIGIGAGLILLRIIVGPAIEKIAFSQMYPDSSWSDWKDFKKTL